MTYFLSWVVIYSRLIYKFIAFTFYRFHLQICKNLIKLSLNEIMKVVQETPIIINIFAGFKELRQLLYSKLD